MAKVEIAESLYEQIDKKFKHQSVEIFQHLKSLEDNPNKGKFLAQVAGIHIKELKLKGFRFYFIVDGYKLKIFSEEELIDLLLRFVRMSDKKRQEQTIDEIKNILIKIGPKGLN